MNGPVLIMAGGTGGHIFPGLAVAQSLREREVPVVWLGASAGMENRLVPAQRIKLETIAFSGVRGKSLATRMLAPFRLLRAVVQARRLLHKHAPRSVLSMGGYAAAPGGIAAWIARIPLVVHEQNSVAGVTNRLLSKLARNNLTGFPDVFHGPRAEWVGNPVRRSIADLAAPAERMAGRSGPLRVLVLGGSQGASSLNKTVPRALSRLTAGNFEIRHQCGSRDIDDVQYSYREHGIDANVVSFIDDMADSYGWADLAVCRAGALTIAELSAAGLASILVPYPQAVDDHQTRNAKVLVDAGAALMLPETELQPESLAAQIQQAGGSRETLLAMANAARGNARSGAVERIVECCLEPSA